MIEVVEQLAALIDDLETADPTAFDDVELHEVTVRLQRLHGRLGVAAGAALAAWEGRGVWAGDQSRTSTARLARELNCSTRTASASLRRARQLTAVPHTVDAVRHGVLSPDHLGLLAAARSHAPERFADDEAMLVEHCARLRFGDAQRVVDYWRQHADPDGSARDVDHAVDGAVAHASTTLHGTVVIDARLDPIGGAVVVDELRRLDDQLRHRDTAEGVVRTAAQRRAAALVEMATRSAAMPAGSRRPRPLFTVLVGDESFTRLCELSTGRVLDPAALSRHIDTAVVETVLFDGPHTVMSVSRRRCFTGALRRAIEVRDRHCQHPAGCDIPAERCDVDHITPWPDSQRTDQHNGRLECPTHNRHPDRHDTDTAAPPPRPVTHLDAAQARQRWRHNYRQRTSTVPLPDDEPVTWDVVRLPRRRRGRRPRRPRDTGPPAPG